jgi:hypothetical protein
MPERLVIAQAVGQGLLERAHRRKEPIIGRTSPQYLPEALDHLQLRTITGQPVQFDMQQVFECPGDHSAFVSGCVAAPACLAGTAQPETSGRYRETALPLL